MVDSISGKSHPLQDADLLGVSQQQSVKRVNTEAAKQSENVSLELLDQANISDEAKKAYESEKEVLRFSRLAQRIKESSDTAKISHLKNLVDSGRINEYLRGLNTEALAENILNSPSGAFLR
ncbi:MAG TPA: hypothetical protein V6C99_12195 [Oculatellaceae cyanobacterium]